MQCPNCGGNLNKCSCAGTERARAAAATSGDADISLRRVSGEPAPLGQDGFRQFLEDLLQFLRDFASARPGPGRRELPSRALSLSVSQEPDVSPATPSIGVAAPAAPAVATLRIPPYAAAMEELLADGPEPDSQGPDGPEPDGHDAPRPDGQDASVGKRRPRRSRSAGAGP